MVELSSWTTSSWPTSTTLKSIDPTHTAALLSTYSSAYKVAATATNWPELISLSRVIRGAEASLAIISAEQVNATATDSQVLAKATQVIFENTINLRALRTEESFYDFRLSRPANIIYFVVFTFLFFYFSLMTIKSRFHWFNITFVCGYALEFVGFLGRVLGFVDDTDKNFFLLQYVPLTISPAFIMGGIYFLFAQMVVSSSPKFLVLRPMWYSYFFITCDVLSLMVQAIGGGMASAATTEHKDTKPGTNVMIAGIAFQVVAMSIFLVFWFEFLHRLYFKSSNNMESTNPLKLRGVANFFKLLFNTKAADHYKRQDLEPYYTAKYHGVRSRKLYNYYPLAITLAVLLIYIRCVYRVVELAQGWSGYLISHEVFLMVLDAFMIAVAGLIFVPFHPYVVFGPDFVIRVKDVRQHKHVEAPSNSDSESGEERLEDENIEKHTA